METYHPQDNQKKEELNVYWEKLKQIIKSHPNKKKLKTFDTLLSGRIQVKNNSGYGVYVRLKSKKIGSEEFTEIKRLENCCWKRFDGSYLAELVALEDLRSKTFLLRTGVNYTVNLNLELIDQNTNLPLQHERDKTFDSKELVFYDSAQRQYLHREIIYENHE